VNATAAERSAMARARELGAAVLGTTSPNPAVGAVVLAADGTPVGEGATSPPGGPHAEVAALARAGERARGGTVVVTLEPCAHTGRTGPCADALIAAGVARVVVAVPEPTELAGGGADRLRAAGIDLVLGVEEAEAEDGALAAWLTGVRKQRPFVVWKVAATLDGRVAAADGSSRWITGEAARRDVHRLRAEVDTMLVGVGTVLADDPQLTVRDAQGRTAPRQPLRVVVDSAGRTPADARVRDDAAATWVATVAEVGADAAGRVDLHALLRRLYDRERRHVLLEGGPRLAGAMIEAGLVDRVVAYVAPVLLGAGLNALEQAGIRTIGAAYRLDPIDVVQVGVDVRVRARPRRTSA
jgi:diaminohydroxyphosphoribosylaminopyrimidine deaminase/5-amino-6-(5-phosphoribosylamino)uracil reductase